jgi:hypothetical protein
LLLSKPLYFKLIKVNLLLAERENVLSAVLDVGETARVRNGVLPLGKRRVLPVLVVLNAAAFQLESIDTLIVIKFNFEVPAGELYPPPGPTSC